MASLFDNSENSSDSEEDSDYVPPVYELSSDEEEPLPSSDDEKVVKEEGKTQGKTEESALNSKVIHPKESESLFDNFDNSSDSEEVSHYVPPVYELSSDEEEPLPSSNDEKVVKKKGKTQEQIAESALNSKVIQCKESESGHNVVDVKKKTDDFKNFLNCASAIYTHEFEGCLPWSSGISCSESTTISPLILNNEKHSQSSSSDQLFDFASETISVSDGAVKSDTSNIPQSPVEEQTPAAVAVVQPVVKRRGPESVLGDVQSKKQKLTDMEESMVDCKTFEKEECCEEELE